MKNIQTKAWAIFAPATGTILYLEMTKKKANDFCRIENRLLRGFTWKAHPVTISYSLQSRKVIKPRKAKGEQ